MVKGLFSFFKLLLHGARSQTHLDTQSLSLLSNLNLRLIYDMAVHASFHNDRRVPSIPSKFVIVCNILSFFSLSENMTFISIMIFNAA